MDEKLDPEKQTHKGFNHQLESFVKLWVNYLYTGKTNYHVVRDIGAEWTANNRIKKSSCRVKQPGSKSLRINRMLVNQGSRG